LGEGVVGGVCVEFSGLIVVGLGWVGGFGVVGGYYCGLLGSWWDWWWFL